MSKEKEKSTTLFTIKGVEFDRSWTEAVDKKYPSFMTLEGFAACQTRPPKSWLGDVDDGDKECKLCESRFPATEEHFYKVGKYTPKKTGIEVTKLSSYCKECDKQKAKLRVKKKKIELHQENIEYDPAIHGEEPPKDLLFEHAISKDPVPIPGWQRCSKCDKWQPRNRDHFKYKKGRPGIQVPRFSGTCRDCDRETRRQAHAQKKIKEAQEGVYLTGCWPLDDPDKKIAEADAYLWGHTLSQLQDMYDVSPVIPEYGPPPLEYVDPPIGYWGPPEYAAPPLEYGTPPAEAPEDELNEQDANNTNVGCTSTTEECGCRVLPISKTA